MNPESANLLDRILSDAIRHEWERTHGKINQALFADLLGESRLRFHVEPGLLLQAARTCYAVAQLVSGACGGITIGQEGKDARGQRDFFGFLDVS